jgi:hypothetical protein
MNPFHHFADEDAVLFENYRLPDPPPKAREITPAGIPRSIPPTYHQDVDSDILDSDCEEDDDSGSSANGADDGENDEIYMSFIRSVFAPGDEERDRSLHSGTDEDDEEYRPDNGGRSDADTNDKSRQGASDDDDDDENYDEEFAHISKHEIQELVDDSWRCVAVSSEADVRPTSLETHSTQHFGSDFEIVPPGSNAAEGERAKVPKEKAAMSALLDKLFAGGKVSDICVDGIEVDSLRRLAARQMSMAMQLLVQMLLLCDGPSRCENDCFKYLMELSNCRSGIDLCVIISDSV